MAIKDHTNLLLALALVGAIGVGAYLSRGEKPAFPPPSGGPPGTGATAAGAGASGPSTAAPSKVPDDPTIAAAVKAIGQEDWNGAREILETVKPEAATYALATYNLGILYEKLAQHAESGAAFERLLRIDPDNADGWIALGWAQFRLGKALEAERATLRAIEVVPNHITARYNLGLFRVDQGRTEEAVRTYQRAFDIDVNRGGFPVALHDLQQYVESHPKSYQAYFTLGLFFHVIGEAGYESASLQRFLAGAPEGPLRDQATRSLAAALAEAKAAGTTVPADLNLLAAPSPGSTPPAPAPSPR